MQRVGDGVSGARGSCSDRSPYLECKDVRRNMGMELGIVPNSIGANQAESRYMRKYKALTKELSQIKRENLAIFGELKNSRARVERLRFEHKLLLDKLKETLNSRRTHSLIRNAKLTQDFDHKYTANNLHKKYPHNLPLVQDHANASRYLENHHDKSKKQSSDTENWDYWNTGGEFDSSSSTCGDWLIRQNDAAESYSCQSCREEQCVNPFASKKSKRQKSKDRDPNAPKRPSNAFMYFCEMQRESLKKQRENLDEREQEKAGLNNLTKALGSRWQALTEDERREWKEQFLAKVEKYYSDMKCYKGNNYASSVQASSQLPSKNSTLDALRHIPGGSFLKSDDEKLKSIGTASVNSGKDAYSDHSSNTHDKSKSSTSQKQFISKIKPQKLNHHPSQEFRNDKSENNENSAFSYSSQSELSDPDPNILGDLESDSLDQDSRHSKDSQDNLQPYYQDD